MTHNWPHTWEPESLGPTPTLSRDRGAHIPVFPDFLNCIQGSSGEAGPAYIGRWGPAFEKKTKDSEHKPHCPSGSDFTVWTPLKISQRDTSPKSWNDPKHEDDRKSQETFHVL